VIPAEQAAQKGITDSARKVWRMAKMQQELGPAGPHPLKRALANNITAQTEQGISSWLWWIDCSEGEWP